MILLSLHFYSILKCTKVTKYGIYDFTPFHIYFIVKCTQVKVTGCGPLLTGGRSAITKTRVDTSAKTINKQHKCKIELNLIDYSEMRLHYIISRELLTDC